LAAIRAYIGNDHSNWDANLNAISGALRAALHRSTGFSAYFLAIGQNMTLNGNDFALLRKMNMLNDDLRLDYPVSAPRRRYC